MTKEWQKFSIFAIKKTITVCLSILRRYVGITFSIYGNTFHDNPLLKRILGIYEDFHKCANP